MAGIYLHIPFCKQKCHYCNFHFSTTYASYRSKMIEALHREIQIKSPIFSEQPLQTIYFGGGTPSLLTLQEVEALLTKIKENYSANAIEEITFEVNPDDVSKEYLEGLQQIGINRISLGVQSFFEDDLTQMNRAHSSNQALSALKLVQEHFDNYSIDFIFALPLLSDEQLAQNLAIAIENNVPHISCYNLTIEEQTALIQKIKKGEIPPLDEEKSVRQFELITKTLAEHKYLQYEISNYAKEGFKSIHNSNYWYQKPYLGMGPSAHSYFSGKRTYNIAHNTKYMDGVFGGKSYFEIELLSDKDRFNEFVLTRLRTSKGIPEHVLMHDFPQFLKSFREATGDFIRSGDLAYFGDEYRLTPKGKLIADHVASSLFAID